jgi:hypothetical protein
MSGNLALVVTSVCVLHLALCPYSMWVAKLGPSPDGTSCPSGLHSMRSVIHKSLICDAEGDSGLHKLWAFTLWLHIGSVRSENRQQELLNAFSVKKMSV